MKKWNRRFLALLLCVTMLIAALGATVYAEDEPAEEAVETIVDSTPVESATTEDVEEEQPTKTFAQNEGDPEPQEDEVVDEENEEEPAAEPEETVVEKTEEAVEEQVEEEVVTVETAVAKTFAEPAMASAPATVSDEEPDATEESKEPNQVEVVEVIDENASNGCTHDHLEAQYEDLAATCYRPAARAEKMVCTACHVVVATRYSFPEGSGKTQHTFGEKETVESGCGGTITKRVCSVCGFVETTLDESADTHEWTTVHVDDKDGACNKPVFCYLECTKCHAKKDGRYVYGTGSTHNFTNADKIEDRVEPTCTEKGYYVQKCNCGETSRKVAIPAKGHTWSTDYKEEAASCGTNGKRYQYCTVCMAQKPDSVQSIPATQAHEEETEHHASTCTVQGYDRVYCLNCGQTIRTIPLPLAKHTYAEGDKDKFDTTFHYKHCTVCEAEIAEAHNMQTSREGCTVIEACSGCNYRTEKTEHEMDPVWRKGEEGHVMQCLHCTYQILERHKLVPNDGDCTKGYHCSVCNAYFDSSAGHIPSSVVLSHDDAGHTLKCGITGCDAAYATEGHSWTADGVCSVCGHARPAAKPGTAAPEKEQKPAASAQEVKPEEDKAPAVADMPATEDVPAAPVLAAVPEGWKEVAEKLTFTEVKAKVADGAPVREVIVHQAEIHDEYDAYMALTVEIKADATRPLAGKVHMSMPVAVDATAFKLVRVLEDGTLEEIEFTYVDGILSFDAEDASLYLLVPVE